jgi:hypothetical protein
MNEELDLDPGQEDQGLSAERPLADPPSTGDARVDAAVAGLSRLPGTPVEDHVAILEEVHGQLRDILGELAEDSATLPGQP